MKRITKAVFMLASLAVLSCNNSADKTAAPIISDTTSATVDSSGTGVIQTLDTAIVLKGLEQSRYKGQSLTENIAKKVLYSYFNKKGYFNADNLPGSQSLTAADYKKLSVDFTEMFLTDLNGNKSKDAVITYWLTPPYAVGNCWQPHKAIIADTDNGYAITNEEFIPDNYAIDSVVNSGSDVTIYGYDYDCGNHQTLKNILVKIK